MEQLTFEKAMQRLEEITEKIQNQEVTLEESLVLYQEGIELSKFCKEQLDRFQNRLEELSKNDQKEQDC